MYLYGASGHAKVIIDILEANNINIEGLYDDNPNIKELSGYKVLGTLEGKSTPGAPFIISIGNNVLRKNIAEKYSLIFTEAIHPSAVISKRASIGEGTVVMGNATINTGCIVGKHVILNTSCTVDHDCELDDYVHISPNACLSGGVIVGEGTHIGSGVSITPNIKIGKWTTIGAGAVIIRDVPDHAVVVGNPGRILRIGGNKEST